MHKEVNFVWAFVRAWKTTQRAGNLFMSVSPILSWETFCNIRNSMAFKLSRAKVATRNEANQPLLLINHSKVAQEPAAVSMTAPSPQAEKVQLTQLVKTWKTAAPKFSELTVLVNEAQSPPIRSHRVKHFYGGSRLEEPISEHPQSTSPQPSTEPVSANSYCYSADISPLPSHEVETPQRQSTSPSPEPIPSRSSMKRVTWKGEEPDPEAQRKMRDFGQWICLGEKGFLKRPIRKTY